MPGGGQRRSRGRDPAYPLSRHPGRQPLLPARCASGGRADQQAWGSLAEYGYVYIPPYCAQGGTCGLHVAFHGCKQGGETDLPFGNIYAKYAGYNEWAKLNAIVVLYPQIQDTTFGPVNPEGCWDWWGYTDANYANQSGRQIRAVAQMINILVHRTDQPLLPVPAGN